MEGAMKHLFIFLIFLPFIFTQFQGLYRIGGHKTDNDEKTIFLHMCKSGTTAWGRYKEVRVSDGNVTMGFIGGSIISGTTFRGKWYEANGLYGTLEFSDIITGFSGNYYMNAMDMSKTSKFPFSISGVLIDSTPPSQPGECILNPFASVAFQGTWSNSHHIYQVDNFYAMLDERQSNALQHYGHIDVANGILVGNYFEQSSSFSGLNYGGALIVKSSTNELSVFTYADNEFSCPCNTYTITYINGIASESDVKFNHNTDQSWSGIWRDESYVPYTYYYITAINGNIYGMYSDGTAPGNPVGIMQGTIDSFDDQRIIGEWYEAELHPWNYGKFDLTINGVRNSITGTFGYHNEDDEESWGTMTKYRFVTSWIHSFVPDIPQVSTSSNPNKIPGTYYDNIPSNSIDEPLYICDISSDLTGSFKGPDLHGSLDGSFFKNTIAIADLIEDADYSGVTQYKSAWLALYIRKNIINTFYADALSIYSTEIIEGEGYFDTLYLKKEGVTPTNALCNGDYGTDNDPNDNVDPTIFIVVGAIVAVFILGVLILCISCIGMLLLKGGACDDCDDCDMNDICGDCDDCFLGFGGGGKYGGAIIVQPDPVINTTTTATTIHTFPTDVNTINSPIVKIEEKNAIRVNRVFLNSPPVYKFAFIYDPKLFGYHLSSPEGSGILPFDIQRDNIMTTSVVETIIIELNQRINSSSSMVEYVNALNAQYQSQGLEFIIKGVKEVYVDDVKQPDIRTPIDVFTPPQDFPQPMMELKEY